MSGLGAVPGQCLGWAGVSVQRRRQDCKDRSQAPHLHLHMYNTTALKVRGLGLVAAYTRGRPHVLGAGAAASFWRCPGSCEVLVLTTRSLQVNWWQ